MAILDITKPGTSTEFLKVSTTATDGTLVHVSNIEFGMPTAETDAHVAFTRQNDTIYYTKGGYDHGNWTIGGMPVANYAGWKSGIDALLP